jgi:hypothetical protein
MAKYGYYKRRARKKPFLSTKQRKVRLAWAREHRHWTLKQWKKVIWTDECSFEVGHDGSQIWVWRKTGEEYLDACLKPTFKSGRTSVMFWGAIGYDMRGPCAILNNGRMTGVKYRDEVLAKHLRPFRNQFRLKHCSGLEPWIVEDGAPCHTAKVSKEYLQANKMCRMVWPSNSPDLNCIENLWPKMKRRVASKGIRMHGDMLTFLPLLWGETVPADFNRFIESMPKRCRAVIAAKGGHIRW